MEEILSIKSAYFRLGQWLRLKNDDLKVICEAYPNGSDNESALNDVLLLWLQQKYNVKKFGPPTWKMLVMAIDKRTGGNNHSLAKEIASNHPAGITSSYIVIASSTGSIHSGSEGPCQLPREIYYATYIVIIKKSVSRFNITTAVVKHEYY